MGTGMAPSPSPGSSSCPSQLWEMPAEVSGHQRSPRPARDLDLQRRGLAETGAAGLGVCWPVGAQLVEGKRGDPGAVQ